MKTSHGRSTCEVARNRKARIKNVVMVESFDSDVQKLQEI